MREKWWSLPLRRRYMRQSGATYTGANFILLRRLRSVRLRFEKSLDIMQIPRPETKSWRVRITSRGRSMRIRRMCWKRLCAHGQLYQRTRSRISFGPGAGEITGPKLTRRRRPLNQVSPSVIIKQEPDQNLSHISMLRNHWLPSRLVLVWVAGLGDSRLCFKRYPAVISSQNYDLSCLWRRTSTAPTRLYLVRGC